LAIWETKEFEEPEACVNLLPDERRADDDPFEAARATNLLAFVLGSETWSSSSNDDDDARARPSTVAPIALLPAPVVTP
jgi:hypothetical protein